MDEQIIELMRDRFDKLNAELEMLHKTLRDHIEMDALYWKKIDTTEAQLTFVKWLVSGVSGSALLAWLTTKFGGR